MSSLGITVFYKGTARHTYDFITKGQQRYQSASGHDFYRWRSVGGVLDPGLGLRYTLCVADCARSKCEVSF